MLLEQPLFYYEAIREKFKNSYLAEDKTQTIIGIDCEYIDEKDMDFYGLRSYFDTNRTDRSHLLLDFLASLLMMA